MQRPVAVLPPVVVHLVLPLLSNGDALRLGATCRRTRTDVLDNLLSLEVKGFVRDDELQPLTKYTNLRQLRIICCLRMSNQAFSYVGCLTNLRQLSLQRCTSITNPGLLHLSSLVALQQLDLLGCPHITSLKPLSQLKDLQRLVLEGCSNMKDGGFMHVRSLTGLQQLNLHGCSQITTKGLVHVTSLSNLENLVLEDCDKLGSKGLPILAKLTTLRQLKIIFCSDLVQDGLQCLSALTGLSALSARGAAYDVGDDMAFMSSLTAIRHLHFDFRHVEHTISLLQLSSLQALESLVVSSWFGGFIDEPTFILNTTNLTQLTLSRAQIPTAQLFSGLAMLAQLDLIHCRVTCLASLSSLTTLRSLSIHCLPDLEGGTFAVLSHLTVLTRLDLNDTQFRMVHISTLNHLRSLSLTGGVTVNGDCLRHLSSLTGLTELKMRECQLTDAGLLHLRGLTDLRELELEQRWATLRDELGLTSASLAHLTGMKALQALKIGGHNHVSRHGAFYDRHLTALCALTNLERLCIKDSKEITARGLVHLTCLRRLRQLELSCCSVTKVGIQHLAKLTRLSKLFCHNRSEVVQQLPIELIE